MTSDAAKPCATSEGAPPVTSEGAHSIYSAGDIQLPGHSHEIETPTPASTPNTATCNSFRAS
jgi:hypothetical protein